MKRISWSILLLWILGVASILGLGSNALASPMLSQSAWVDIAQITNKTGIYWNSPRISGNGEWVTFIEGTNVYLGRTNGSNVHTINLASFSRFVDINADGSIVAVAQSCAVEVHQNGVTRSLLPIVNFEGRQKALCSNTASVAISGNGQWFYYISSDPWPCVYVNDSWQCSGNLDGSREVWRIHVRTGAVTQVTNFNTGPNTGPWWVSTDFSGTKVAFTAGNDSMVHVYSVNGDGSGLRQLAEVRPGPTQYTHRNLTFISGDGLWIIFTGKNASGFSAVNIIRSDGSERRLIRDNYGCDHGPHGSNCSISYNGAIIAVGTLFYTTEILDNQGNLLETISAEELDLSYDGLRVAFLSRQDKLGLGSETDEQVFAMKRGVTKHAPLEAMIGSRMTYTVTLRHGETTALSASLIDPLPAHTTYVPDSLQVTKGAADYNSAQHQITWNEEIAAGETVTITFAITPSCTTVPPPPGSVSNRITATLGTLTLHPMAITALSLPEKDLTTLSDAPTNGATDVLIESGSKGPLLQWHDQAPGMTCGATSSADVAYRVYLHKSGGDWQEVGSYPNCSRQVQLTPQALSCQDNGEPAPYEWKVITYDPHFVCRKPVESVFGFTTASCRPEIEVKPEFTLAPGYFLDRTNLTNPIEVTVDWNGPAYETPVNAAPYGVVTFDLNGKITEKQGLQWGAEQVYDMGTDFNAKFSCANNTLNIWAKRPAAGGKEYESLKTTLQPTVFPFPNWVEWVITNIPGSDSAFEMKASAPLVVYNYDFKYPEPAFEATWTPPGWIPYLGGRELGIQETQAEANAEVQSDGAGSARVTGNTGLDLGAFASAGSLWGQGDAHFTCGESLALERVEMGFSINATVEKEAGLADVIPAVRAAENWPIVGRIVRWVNSIAVLKAAFTPGVEVSTEFIEQGGMLIYNKGQGTGSIDVKATLATEACKGLSAEAYGGGAPYITIQVPKSPDYLKEVGLNMYYGAAFQAWSFEAEYERKINCNYPGGCSEVAPDGELLATFGLDWHLIPRDYIGPNYGAVTAPPARHPLDGLGARVFTSDGEVVLIPQAYVHLQPALAVQEDGFRLLAYVHDDVSKPQGRGTEIRVLSWDGSWSIAPFDLTEDIQPDYAPAIAFDGNGNGIVMWERSVLPAGITPTLGIDFAQSLEIVARPWLNATATWGPLVVLTDNSLMDHSPRLSTGADGSVIALWETTDGTDALGTAGHPLTYSYARWDGSSWSAPTAALIGLTDILAMDLAVYSATQAALVYVQDMDGVISTTADAELYYSLFNGTTWSAPTRLTNDVVVDSVPSLVYNANGQLSLVWLRNSNLVALTGSWDIADLQMVKTASSEGGVLDFTLSRSPSEHLALVWQAMGENGADLTYAILDGKAGLWSAARTLMTDVDVEKAQSLVFADDGMLYLAYQKVATEFITRTFEISPTQIFTVTNLPQPGNSQLVFLTHNVDRDLTFDSFSLTPSNPTAGEVVTLTVILRNTGDLVELMPVVRFYDGVEVITTETLPITLSAGYTTTVSINWTVPTPAAMHTLQAMVDPENIIAETDESNNEISVQTTLPDLTTVVLYTTNARDAITATARLKNAGVLTARAPFTVTFRVADPVTGTILGKVHVIEDIPVGESLNINLPLMNPATLVGLGEKLWVIADEEGCIVEANEDNNTAYARLAVLPDLTLTAADIQGHDTVTITVYNHGIIAASYPVLKVWSGSITGTLVYSTALDILQPGANQIVTFTTDLNDNELWVYIDPQQQIPESNEGNNLAVRDMKEESGEDRRWLYLPLVLRGSP